MVLAEKGNENARNGRRSRGPSPNGHVAAESTSEDESTGTFFLNIIIYSLKYGCTKYLMSKIIYFPNCLVDAMLNVSN